jgi:23S rRNA (guanine745-N1)-methyltransferase
MIDAAMPYLRCPVCEEPLARAGERTLRCARGHAFDIAKQGYAGLTTGRTPHSGDAVEMVTAREDFLAAGHYAFIAEALSGLAGGDFVVDAGVGTGYYLARVLDGLPEAAGLGLDVSKPALRRAARAHPRAAAVLADLWRPLPIRDAAASLILNVFAPRNGSEFRRVLRPDGLLVVVTPAAEHLTELITAYGLIGVDPDKAERVSDSLGAHFTAVSATTLRRRLRLTGDEMRTLVGMTPSARHLDPGALPGDEVEATAAVEITVFAAAGR